MNKKLILPGSIILIGVFVSIYFIVGAERSVITGPVDSQRGLRGILEKGMTRDEVISHLGEPEIEPGYPFPEEGDEYFKGIFARTRFNMQYKALSIDFRPDEVRLRYNIDQRIALSVKGKVYMLDSSTKLTDLSNQFRKDKIPFHVSGPSITLANGGAFLTFENSGERFNRLSIYW